MSFIVIFIALIALILSTMGLLVNEQFVLLFVVDIGIVLVTFGIINALSSAKIRKKAIKDGALDAAIATHIDGLGLGSTTNCELRNYGDRLEINPVVKSTSFSVAIDKIRAVEIKNIQEFKDVDRSVIGRAAIGTLLVPGLGTIVGGMSGLKSKKKSKNTMYLIINYLSNDGELKGITFEHTMNLVRLNNFAMGLNKTLTQVNQGRVIEL